MVESLWFMGNLSPAPTVALLPNCSDSAIAPKGRCFIHPDGILSPLSLGGVRGGEERILSPPLSHPQGDDGGDKRGVFPYFLERYSSRMMVALILSTNALSCLAFLEIPLSSMARWAMTDVKRSSKSSM